MNFLTSFTDAISTDLPFSLDLLARATIILLIAITADRWLCSRKKFLAASTVWTACLIALLALPLFSIFVQPAFHAKSNSLPTETIVYQDYNGRYAEEARSQTLPADAKLDTDLTKQEPKQLAANQAPQALGRAGNTSSKHSYAIAISSKLNGVMIFAGLILAGYVWFVIRFIRLVAGSLFLIQSSRVVRSKPVLQLFANLSDSIGLRKKHQLRESDSIQVPMVIGFFRPQVIVPARLVGESNYSLRSLEAMLIHELTHIKRRDPIWNLVLEFTVVLYWFHPLVWFARIRIADLREHACDDFCIRQLGDTRVYVDTLVELATNLIAEPNRDLRVAAVRRSKLAKRIVEINKMKGCGRPLARVSIRCLASILAITIGFVSAGVSVFATPPQDDQAQTDASEQLTDVQRAAIAKLLDVGDDEVENKDEVLRFLLKKSEDNFGKIKTWEGTFESYSRRKIPGRTPDDTLENVTLKPRTSRGRFAIDSAQKIYFSDLFSVEKPTKLKNGMTSVAIDNSRFDPRCRSRQKSNQPMDANTIVDHLKALITFENIWERTSLSETSGPEGKVITLKQVHGSGDLENEGMVYTCRFTEANGYQLTSSNLRMKKIKLHHHQTIDYQQVDGIYIPSKITDKQGSVFGDGSVVRDSETINIYLSRLNDELTFQHAFDIFQDQNNLNEGRKGNIPFIRNTAKDSAPNFGQEIRDDRLELRADKNGKLAKIVTVSEHGEGKRYSNLDELTTTIETFLRQLDHGIAQNMKVIFVADNNLNPIEIERVKKAIQFKIKLDNGQEVTVPLLVFR